uniref:Uncharacterized protein n=1 Tax=Anguilla anguilla TaxID=7936 RepID=A0A0E9W9V0_ANGAN
MAVFLNAERDADKEVSEYGQQSPDEVLRIRRGLVGRDLKTAVNFGILYACHLCKIYIQPLALDNEHVFS